MRPFTDEICAELKYYVYVYLDPTSKEIFYVGHGKGNRAFDHLADTSESEKCARVRAIREAGRQPVIEILVHGLDRATALQVEAAAIDLIGAEQLTNVVRGWRSGVYGRMTVDQVRAQYAAAEVEITHPCILIRINDLFRYGMAPIELYDATRGVWKAGPNRAKAKYALAIFDGVVQEVYEIAGWFAGGSTLYTRDDTDAPDRWEFVGRVAPERIRDRYRFRAVRRYFPQGAQNPIRYVGVGAA
jgi:uncharacterized protein